MLTEQQKQQLLERIVLSLEEVMGQGRIALGDIRDSGMEKPMIGEAGQGPVEQTILIAQYALERSNVRWDKLRLRKRELEHGEFEDTCDDCGKEIPFDRLLAQPTTHHCRDCKAQEEQMYQRKFGTQPGRHHISKSAYVRTL
jgi:RNA polymerase-binding transcription factor DksA